ncbi:redoxin domain-containing protein [Fulvivirga ligni]|uniref:redoxin domain-containing protein n=1 Tax=Fulvivirga ligni TaxID=2904246 RepID=UPI001F2D16EF|nr:redoxin domain-containing protein [Fulvivirga ligni]UII18982.1 redoxin domain-containing protein [Fulvivirga ligni]
MKCNYLFLFSLLLLVVFACETKPDDEVFTLEATLTDIPDSTLFYLRDEAGITMDSAYVTNGKILLESNHIAKRPEKLMLLSLSPEFIYSYLLVVNEHVTFKADKSDFPWNVDMIGSRSQDEAEKFNKIEYHRQQLSKNLKTRYGSDDQLLSEKLSDLSDSLDTEIVKLLKDNFNSYAALNIFKYHKLSFSAQELSSLYSQLDDELKETKMAKAVKLQSAFPKPEVGAQYYDYSAINQDGDTLSLSDIQNKYTLLHFSSYACFGSQLSLPELKELHGNYLDDLEIISISTDLDRESWENHVKRDSVTWNYLWDGKGDYNDAYVKYWQYGTPTYVLISPEKVILEEWSGYGEGLIRENVTKHLKSSPIAEK